MARFTFFGGKGGVGKTTVSAAYALRCADAGEETLIVSTDPAHSTSDVFEQSFDDDPTSVEGRDGLSAMEIDPEAEVEAHMMDIRREMEKQVSQVVVNEIDKQIEMAHETPGAYEAALFDRLIRVMREEADDYDRVVFDTAPTGNTLRLLSLPEFLGDWVDRLIEKREKSLDLYEKAAIGTDEPRKTAANDPIIHRLREREEKFEFAGRILREESSFYLVLNPDDLSVAETRRAVEHLGEHDLDVRGLVVNKVTPEPDDDENGRGARYLRERCARERERIAETEETIPVPLVARIASRTGEVKGDVLGEVADELAIDVAATP
ncbi:arsenical pump-driving ATPase [Halarchaeum acidiphilum MH1-52-1]|uniref:Arsenical pump-driving ATPase n=1 Tax=Halarchaeum acidiphilum MH1-52-1 TaxID=1261545 RepID=U2YQN2_9EURY|nr:TRC40/GET3/ArsA family transport-energizing ATPase [Halarchaeum acidiphilum]GAD51280.1 arsenical pump-driving ATPase [Halarchaeum acidiphilum MH1-52-1]